MFRVRHRASWASLIAETLLAPIHTSPLVGRSRPDVIALLGDPDITDCGPLPVLCYEIRVHYRYNIDPVSGTYLVVEFGPNGLVNNVRTEDWKVGD